jgi:hypothetical protein
MQCIAVVGMWKAQSDSQVRRKKESVKVEKWEHQRMNPEKPRKELGPKSQREQSPGEKRIGKTTNNSGKIGRVSANTCDRKSSNGRPGQTSQNLEKDVWLARKHWEEHAVQPLKETGGKAQQV